MRLANVAVHPERRGAGLGRAFMELAESEAMDQGYVELRLNTHAGMPESIQLYGHLGWEQTARDQLYGHLGWEQTARDGNKVSMKKML
jgi:GNAT superfamily N-acetyltransferase